MGYSTDYRNRLCCDSCGTAGGVRKRKCAYTIRDAALYSKVRHTLHYCPAPALCADCYRKHGGLRGVHGDACRDGAAQSQAREDAIQASLEQGEFFTVRAYGSDRADTIPEGWTGIVAAGLEGVERDVLVTNADYDRRTATNTPLSFFTTTKDWVK